MELALSILLMVAVVGTLVGWAFREDRRRRRANDQLET
jgi:hypothetical protein